MYERVHIPSSIRQHVKLRLQRLFCLPLHFRLLCMQDMAQRSARRQLEFVWRSSQSWGASADVLAHNYPTGNYSPPPGFNWDWGLNDPYIVVSRALPARVPLL